MRQLSPSFRDAILGNSTKEEWVSDNIMFWARFYEGTTCGAVYEVSYSVYLPSFPSEIHTGQVNGVPHRGGLRQLLHLGGYI